jgi:hypothetical protein
MAEPRPADEPIPPDDWFPRPVFRDGQPVTPVSPAFEARLAKALQQAIAQHEPAPAFIARTRAALLADLAAAPRARRRHALVIRRALAASAAAAAIALLLAAGALRMLPPDGAATPSVARQTSVQPPVRPPGTQAVFLPIGMAGASVSGPN